MIIRFEFHGGHKNGQVVTGGPRSRYAFLTDSGRVGARFRELPEERQEELRQLLSEEFRQLLKPEKSRKREEIRERCRELMRIKPEVYEVKHRDETAEEILVRVELVGDDETDQLYPS